MRIQRGRFSSASGDCEPERNLDESFASWDGMHDPNKFCGEEQQLFSISGSTAHIIYSCDKGNVHEYWYSEMDCHDDGKQCVAWKEREIYLNEDPEMTRLTAMYDKKSKRLIMSSYLYKHKLERASGSRGYTRIPDNAVELSVFEASAVQDARRLACPD